MTSIAKCSVALFALLCATMPALAGSCADDIAQTQAQLDLAIEKDAGSHGWKPESLSALRSHQPTPRSLAEAEGGNGVDFHRRARLARSRAHRQSRRRHRRVQPGDRTRAGYPEIANALRGR
ncbi:hypothetical protein [Bradyrhizobium diazoefficiens]|uniref:hypothetical protein n=1 Tax=Bradyrhizobium diazoefficiens TaxID=1355477 RepID=UPI00346F4314